MAIMGVGTEIGSEIVDVRCWMWATLIMLDTSDGKEIIIFS